MAEYVAEEGSKTGPLEVKKVKKLRVWDIERIVIVDVQITEI